MNEPNAISNLTTGQSETQRGAGLPRLRFPFICLVVFWALSFLLAQINKPYFVGFMSGMALSALITLLFLGWWWFNRRLRWWEKAAGFALLVVEAGLVGKLAHHSVTLFTLWFLGLPVLASLIVGWIFLVKKLGVRWPRLGFLLVVTIGWSGFLLIRFDSADSSLKMRTHLRWTPTAEEQFMAGAGLRTESPSTTATPSTTEAATTSQSAPDWVSFRGPERDGVILASTIAMNWEGNPPKLVWKRAVGPAWSSLIVVGGKLYTQEQRGEKEVVACYNAASGEPLWIHEDQARFDEAVSGPGPRGTPTFANGRLYTMGGTGLLSCLDASTGRQIWQADAKQASDAKVPMWAFASSPLVSGDKVIVYAGGESGKGLLAYRAGTGELAWAAQAGSSSYSSPQLTTLAGVTQCLMFHDGGLSAFDPATGRELWKTGMAMKGAPRCGQPHLIGTNQLLVGVLNGMGSSLIEVSTNSSGWTAAARWDSRDLKPEFPDFVVHKGYAYGFDIGVFCCLNLSDGKRTWKEGRYGRGEVMLLRDQDLLLITSETGELILLAADPGSHREVARFQALQGKTWNHPVVIGDRVFLRNAQEMACYAMTPSKQSSLSARN